MSAEVTVTRPPRGRRAGREPVERWAPYLRLVYSESLPLDAPEMDPIHEIAAGPAGALLGRDPGEDGRSIAIPFDACASRQHARLTVLRAAGEIGVVVEDLGTRNGTRCNREPIVGTTVASSGAVLRVGGSAFVVGCAPLARRAKLLSAHAPPPVFQARSWPALALWADALKAADGEDGVLLLGETGTGKTRLARHIHQRSRRRTR